MFGFKCLLHFPQCPSLIRFEIGSPVAYDARRTTSQLLESAFWHVCAEDTIYIYIKLGERLLYMKTPFANVSRGARNRRNSMRPKRDVDCRACATRWGSRRDTCVRVCVCVIGLRRLRVSHTHTHLSLLVYRYICMCSWCLIYASINIGSAVDSGAKGTRCLSPWQPFCSINLIFSVVRPTTRAPLYTIYTYCTTQSTHMSSGWHELHNHPRHAYSNHLWNHDVLLIWIYLYIYLYL